MIFKLFLLFSPAFAALQAVGTTPDVAWLLGRVGGSAVEVKSLAKPSQNFHFLEARPDFILAVARADLLCRVGADLEIGWLPKVLERAANAKVATGGPGDCDLSRTVSVLEKPVGKVDRSMGDTHLGGNPHYWLSPARMAEAAQEVERVLAKMVPERAAFFAENRRKLEDELKDIQKNVSQKLRPLAGKSIYEYHKEFFYFFQTYGLRSLGSIEEIPGVPPSAARLGAVAQKAKQEKAILALASVHYPKASLEKFQEMSGVLVLQLDTSLADFSAPEAYRSWQEALADRLVRGK